VRERFVGYNFSHVNIKVRSCPQQASPRDHSGGVDETPFPNEHAMEGSQIASDAKLFPTASLYARLAR
jgi:hypothetical protein